jgi:hypothetical protein
MAHIDDLIKPRLEQIVLAAVPALLRPHPRISPAALQRQRITQRRPDQFARKSSSTPSNPAKLNAQIACNRFRSHHFWNTSRTTQTL